MIVNTYKNLILIITTSVFFIINTPSIFAQNMSDLIWRDGSYYKKFSDVPFTGKILGNIRGAIVDGKKNGTWVQYHKNGQLFSLKNFKQGLLHGAWFIYDNRGFMIEKGNYKNNHVDGIWIRFFDNEELNYKGSFNKGKKNGPWVKYYYNGQLEYKGSFKNGKKDGIWEYFTKEGIRLEEYSGIFQVGKKISNST